LGQLILNKGSWNGKQLVSQKYIEELSTPAAGLLNEWGTGPLTYYGYQWWITKFRNQKVVYARGILGQYIFVLPSENMVIVRLGEKRCSLRTGNLPSDLYFYLNLGLELAK
jgi:CubicO group peptidase (beta-lactamase class C family)